MSATDAKATDGGSSPADEPAKRWRSYWDYRYSRKQNSTPLPTDDSERTASIREIYKKHAAELLAMEDHQHKFLLFVMGILSVGATLLGKLSEHDAPLSHPAKIGLSILATAIMIVGIHYTLERHAARQAARDLLVRCELALGLYQPDRYFRGEAFYDEHQRAYPSKGHWLRDIYWVVIATWIGFLILIWA